MYAVPEYAISDETVLRDWIRRYPFGVLSVNGEDGPVMAQIPFVISSSSGKLVGHAWRHNTLFSGSLPEKAVVLFQGPNSYISPGWYPSKAEHGKVVPTWNYISIEVRGRLSVETDPGSMAEFLSPLVDQMEQGREPAWKLTDAPEDYLSRLCRGIVGISIEIESLTGLQKLSQTAREPDFKGAVKGLLAEANPSAHLVADEMMKLREA